MRLAALVLCAAVVRADEKQPASGPLDSGVLAAWHKHLQGQGQPQFDILASATESGDTWIGTFGAGLALFSGDRFSVFSQMSSGLAGNIVFDVTVFDGSVWAATNGGVSRFDPAANEWTLFNARTAQPPQSAITKLWRAGDRLCASEWRGSVFVYEADPDAFVRDTDQRCGHAGSHSSEPSQTMARSEPSLSPAVPPRNASPAAIAIYGPRNRTISLPGARGKASIQEHRPDVSALEMALDQNNKDARHRPLALMMARPGYANYAWGLPEDDLVYFAQQPQVLAVIAYITEGEHITDAVAARMDVPWMNVAPPAAALDDGDSVDHLVFQCWGDEPRQHRAVFDYLMKRAGGKRVAFISSDNRASARHIGWWEDYARRSRAEVAADLQWSPASATGHSLADKIREADADVVFTWGACQDSLDQIKLIHAVSERSLIVAGPDVMECDAHEASLENVVSFLPYDHSDAEARAAKDPKGVGLTPPSPSPSHKADSASRTRHATEHLIFAINLAGPSRAAVRQMLETLARSAFGEEHFERDYAAEPVRIAEFTDGAWRATTLPTQ